MTGVYGCCCMFLCLTVTDGGHIALQRAPVSEELCCSWGLRSSGIMARALGVKCPP